MTLRQALLLCAFALPLGSPDVADAQRSTARAPVSSVVVVREQRVLRIPLRPTTALPVPRPLTEWKEGRAPRCLARSSIAAATVNGLKDVDFILRDRRRIRARLQNSCPALDYYQGFYLKPTSDGNVCQDRDSIHARSGGECQIDRFRTLRPGKPR